MSRNSGTIVMVIEGPRKGQYGIMYNKEQEQKFIDAKKRYVHFYGIDPADDFMDMKNTKGKGLINIDFLRGIGKID